MTYSKTIGYTKTILKSKNLPFDYAKDLIHDEWIYHFNRTGRNLLDEKPGFIWQAMDWRVGKDVAKHNVMSNGQKILTTFEDVENHHNIGGGSDPEQILNTKEFYQCAYKAVGDDKNILEYIDQGYNNTEIAKMLDIPRHQVENHKKKIKKIMSELVNSPFVGSKLKVKRITLTEYTNHPEKYEEYEYNVDRDSDENEYFKQLSHKTEDHGLLVVLAKRLDL
jgi:hypothetical protein